MVRDAEVHIHRDKLAAPQEKLPQSGLFVRFGFPEHADEKRDKPEDGQREEPAGLPDHFPVE
jgi:hypothetical protein